MKKKTASSRKKAAVKNQMVPATEVLKHVPKGISEDAYKKQLEGTIRNSLSEALFGFGIGDFGPMVSSTEPQFENLRWYLITNFRQLLSEMYVEHGIVATVVDVPVDDAFRGGVNPKTGELTEEELSKLKFVMNQNDDIAHVVQAKKWERLFGGGAIIIMTDQDPSTPLDVEAITEDSELEFRAVDMWELFYAKQSTEDYDEAIDGEYLDNVEYYDYYGVQLHHSRVLTFRGKKAPSFIRPKLRGWGMSVVEVLVRSFNQYLKAVDLTYEVLDEFKVDVFKIKNLANTLMTDEGVSLVRRRIQLANMEKNYQHAITMDAEDDYTNKQLSFTGLAEVMTGIRMQAAAEIRMPISKIFGISASGFSSGEDDIENYNGMIEGSVREPSKRALVTMFGLRCRQLFGMIPEDLEAEFQPLRVLSAEQEENVKTLKYNRVLQGAQSGLIDGTEFRDNCNKDKLLPLELDRNKALEIEQDNGEDDGTGAAAPKGAKAGKKSATKPKEAKEAKT